MSNSINLSHADALIGLRDDVVAAMMDCSNPMVSLDGLISKALDYLDPECPCACMDLLKATLIANRALSTILAITNGAAPVMRHVPCPIDGITGMH